MDSSYLGHQTEVSKLKELIKQRDNEISILCSTSKVTLSGPEPEENGIGRILGEGVQFYSICWTFSSRLASTLERYIDEIISINVK